MKTNYDGKELIITTPNGTEFSNTLLGIFKREAQHPDHTQVFTYKILNTLCLRAKFASWEIVPYRFTAAKMILQSRGLKLVSAHLAQWFIRRIERAFPLLSFGYIVRIQV